MQDADIDSVNDGLAEAMASIPAPEPAASDAAPEPEKEGESEGSGQPRDERGRFKSDAEKAADAAAESAAKPDGEDRDGGQIPSWRLRELREERDRIASEREQYRQRLEALERERAQWLQQQRQMQEAEEAPQRPDPMSDPEGYYAWINQALDQRVKSLDEQFRDRWVNLTFAQQHEQHGKVFDEAMAALERARSPQIVAEIREAVDPGKALMRWYRRQAVLTEVGDDPEGYKKRLRDQFKKDPEFRKEFMAELEAEARAPAGRSSGTVTNLPSLNRATGGGGRQQLGDLGSSDREIFETLTRKRG